MNLTRSLLLSLIVLFAMGMVSPSSLAGSSQSSLVACKLPPAPPKPPVKK
jgi:hypothetical protein